MLSVLAILSVAYLVGSIPTSIIAGKLLRGIDIREHGSGNAGATNSFRVLGTPVGIVVSLIDLSKGLFATLVVSQIRVDALPAFFLENGDIWMMLFAGLAAVIGHVFTLFAGFRGGKGVATGAGMLVGLAPVAIAIAAALFAIIVLATRYVSLGSILATISVPVTVLLQRFAFNVDVPAPVIWICAFVPILIVYTHRANVQRLMHGTESRVGKKPPAAQA
jgi:acyl phosphate:glycerol-3-phosphate acyltransferase